MVERVLVTRPEPGASRTALRLAEAGYQPVVVPLSEIVPLEPQVATGAFQAVAISSANATRHAPNALVARLAGLPVFAVGDASAVAAREAGFANIHSSAGSAAELARDIAAGVRRPARIAYLCGRVRRDALESELSEAGFEVTAIETYDTRIRTPSGQEVTGLDTAPIAAALVYSAEAAAALSGLAKSHSATIFRDTTFIAISERVAERLIAVAPGRVISAVTPDEDAMFELLP